MRWIEHPVVIICDKFGNVFTSFAVIDHSFGRYHGCLFFFSFFFTTINVP